MKILIPLSLAIAAPAVAQTNNLQHPYFDVGQSANFNAIGLSGNPALRAARLRQALALRDEALQLQEQDGGTLTQEHQRYVQRRSRQILARN